MTRDKHVPGFDRQAFTVILNKSLESALKRHHITPVSLRITRLAKNRYRTELGLNLVVVVGASAKVKRTGRPLVTNGRR